MRLVSRMSFLLVTLAAVALVEVTSHNLQWDSFKPDFYRDSFTEIPVQNARICTRCSEGNPDCIHDAMKTFKEKKEESKMEKHHYPPMFSPFALDDWKTVLVQTNLKVSCWLESETDDALPGSTHEGSGVVSAHTKASGLIFINRAYYGKDFNRNCDLNTEFDFCFENAFSTRGAFGLCNGQYDCELYGLPSHIQQCNQKSDFLHVDYQCIPESHIFNIGEYSSSQDRPDSSFGYIISPNYPREPSRTSSFECILQIHDSRANGRFVLTNLDFHLAPGNDFGCCFNEYVEIQNIRDETIVDRKRYCGNHNSGESTTLVGNKVRVLLVTDWHPHPLEMGFWAKYEGFNDATEAPLPVDVTCGFFDPFNEVKLRLAPGVQTFEGNWCTGDYNSEDEESNSEEDSDESDVDDEDPATISTTTVIIPRSPGNGNTLAENQVQNGDNASGRSGKYIVPLVAGLLSCVLVIVAVSASVYCVKRRENAKSDTTNLDRQIEKSANMTNEKVIPTSSGYSTSRSANVSTNREAARVSTAPPRSVMITESTVYHNASGTPPTDTCSDSMFDDGVYEMLPDFESQGPVNAYECPSKLKHDIAEVQLDMTNGSDGGYASLQPNNVYIVLADSS